MIIIKNKIKVDERKKMKKTKRNIINLIFFILLMIITFYVVFKEKNIDDIFKVISNVRGQYVLIAVCCMVIYVLCESINIRRTLKALNEKITILSSMKYALIGFFFSGITPAASGGQPMQIYYMYKDKISVANSTLTLLINLSCVQIVTISLALISVIFNYKYLNQPLAICFVIGILLNASALTLLIIAIFSKRLIRKLINFLIKIMTKLNLKNIEEKKEKLENEISKYQNSSIYIKNNIKVILKTLLITYIQFILFYSVSYWIYRSFGLNEMNIIKITMIQALLYGTVSGIPLPGAIGVSEGGFLAIFNTIYSENMVSSAMLLSRGINFYFLITISGIVTIINIFMSKRVEKS